MYRLSIVLTLCTYGALAFLPREYELPEQVVWPNDQPSTATGGNSKCKKDILLVVDTSWSIGNDFNKNVKPFLQSLVTNNLLNVGPDGTRIGLIIFGQADKTKKILDVGEITDAEELAKKINSKLDYRKVGGSLTRTDIGLRIANEVFDENNPKNHRSNIDDVVILITDGAPRGRRDTVTLTKKYAQDLKDKHILLIVAAVGPERKKFKPLMEELATSREMVLEADFNNMKNIMDKLIASSCIKPGQCTCVQPEANYKLKPGESTVNAYWPKPEFTCASGGQAAVESTVVSPNIRPPHRFSVGKHVVTYKYNLKGDVTVVCPVIINVKGKLCGGLAYSRKEQVCCCGTAHNKKAGHRCCGKDYYDQSTHHCCEDSFSVFLIGNACPKQ